MGFRIACLVALLVAAADASAHERATSYLRLKVEDARIRAQLDLAVADAATLLGLESTDPGALLRAHGDALLRRVARGLGIASSGGVACSAPQPDAALAPPEAPGFVRVQLVVTCNAEVESVELSCPLLADLDPAQRVFVWVERDWLDTRSVVLSRNAESARFSVAPPGAGQIFAEYFVEGIGHIGTGLDHILFLIVLLLPAGLMRPGHREPYAPRHEVIVDVLRTVTAFTVAHSLTLALSALHFISPDPRQVEAAIALSVAVAALHNVQTRFHLASWPLAGAFGLLHGMGFAAMLDLLGLPPHARVLALFAFNVGVEAGQLVIVAAVLPLVLVLRRRSFYRTAVVEVPSFAVAWLAAIWMYERVFGVVLLG